MKKVSSSLKGQIIGVAVFTALLLGAMIFFLSVYSPSPYQEAIVLDRSYNRDAMKEAMDAKSVEERFQSIIALGSRAPGQKGLSDMEALFKKEFKDAGLEVYEQDVALPYALTDGGNGTITFSDKSTQVTWPFYPNHTQPVVTPKEGLTGELFLVTEDSVRKEKDFSNKIAVVDLAEPLFKDLGYNPAQYIELGFKAVILTHKSGLEEVPWKALAGNFRIRSMPINLVRLAAEPEILSHIGEEATVTAVSRFVNAQTHNVVGVLRGKEKNNRALIIPMTYDAASIIPDYALGQNTAFNSAVGLQILKGLVSHKDELRRDVIFVALTGQSQTMLGASRMISTIGEYGKSDSQRIRIEADLKDNQRHLDMLRNIEEFFNDEKFAVADELAVAEAAVAKMDNDTRRFFADRVAAVMRKSVFEQSEKLLVAEIDFKRNPDDLSSPEFKAFRAAKQRYDDINNVSSLPFARSLERPIAKEKVFFDEEGNQVSIREALRSHLKMLMDFHREKALSIEKDLALQKLFASYDSLVVYAPQLQPAVPPKSAGMTKTVEELGYLTGNFAESSANNGESANLFGQLVNDSIYALGLEKDATLIRPKGSWAFSSLHGGNGFESNPWAVASIPAFTLISPKNSFSIFETPFVEPAFTNVASIANSLQVAGEIAIGAGRGWGNFGRLPYVTPYSFHGSVFASGVGNSVVPNYAVSGALVASLDNKPFIFTDPYGKYNHPFLTMPCTIWGRFQAPEAFHFNREGLIDYVKDNGVSAQNIYKSKSLPTTDTPVNLILYRASPVAILNIVNPQSMKAFTSADFITSSGLSAFDSTSPYKSTSALMNFIPPKEYFFITLKAGAPGNDLVATTRAFCLGLLNKGKDNHYKPNDEEIDGPGYLAYDTPIVRNITKESEASMAWLANKRLDLQKRYGMADDMTLALDKDASEIAARDNESGHERPLLSRSRDLRQALSYLILNHPVIRGSVTEAVWGILWYMGLLVPFIFFFEKLVFGFTDVRKQILAEGAIFLIVFMLLRLLHPAFYMIRSSAMILLGFVIIIIVASVTSVLSTKFQENLDAMRASQGMVKGAQGNTFGIVMTAFMLGLNNMHRRKVRTGLTCATLVLMTFVMICFTSVQSNITEKERAIGRAAYQGIIVREKLFAPISQSEVNALNAAYGENHTVNLRQAYIGSFDQGTVNIPNYELTFGEGDSAITRTVKAGLGFTATEPLRDSITLITTNGWFTKEQAALTHGPYPVIIPDDVAEQLGVDAEMVNSGKAPIKISGNDYFVWGIFKSSDLANAVDVDGENLLPFDIEGITNPQMQERYVLAENTDPRVQPSDVILSIVNQLTDGGVEYNKRIISVAVDMGSVPYSTARSEISAYLIQTGRDCNYGLDGTAFNGRRARARSMAGMADLIIPLIIAALTVLNTMKGSVYERKSEIFVYNAVGIAPRYIFFMFVAEALVYSVVGAVLGYILAQGTGKILTAINLTGGMNMNFTSVTTIYASLAIAAATLASTYFPARSAIEIAKPTDDAGWSLPTPGDDDSITFSLPFTFTHYDRIAVLSFFYNYFENFGEGSSGAFFSGQPRLTISDKLDPLENDGYIPRIEVQVWLKPFDLGVSQMITIDLPTDSETKEYISQMRLVRLTGTRDAWLRLNKPMVALIRQHFLHWRAVPKETKVGYFEQAKQLLEEGVTENA